MPISDIKDAKLKKKELTGRFEIEESQLIYMCLPKQGKNAIMHSK